MDVLTLYNFENEAAKSFFKATGFCTIPPTAIEKWTSWSSEKQLKPVLGLQVQRPKADPYQWCTAHAVYAAEDKYAYVVMDHTDRETEPAAPLRYDFLNALYPTTPIIHFGWADYLRIPDRVWIPSKYWPDGAERRYVSLVAYRPQDLTYMAQAMEHGDEEATKAGIPMALWLSLGVGYGDDGSTWGEVQYPKVNDKIIAMLCKEFGVSAVIVHPAPGDERYPNMAKHIDTFLQAAL